MTKIITVGGESVEISDEQYEAIMDEARKEISNYEDLVGSKFYFRTVTYHTVGEVKKIVGRFAQLKNASWVCMTAKTDWFTSKQA